MLLTYRNAIKHGMSYLRILRLVGGRFNLQGITCQNAPKLLALQVKDGEYKQQERNYKNFGHKRPEPATTYSKFYCSFLTIVMVGAAVDWNWLILLKQIWNHFINILFFRLVTYIKHKLNVKAEAETIQEGIEDDSSDESSSEGSDEDGKKKKKSKEKVGFRDRKVRAVLA